MDLARKRARFFANKRDNEHEVAQRSNQGRRRIYKGGVQILSVPLIGGTKSPV